ncbi:TPA: hypothetical protein ACH3X3_000740 [Trebouxia sp. C0006]
MGVLLLHAQYLHLVSPLWSQRLKERCSNEPCQISSRAQLGATTRVCPAVGLRSDLFRYAKHTDMADEVRYLACRDISTSETSLHGSLDLSYRSRNIQAYQCCNIQSI